MSVNNEDCRMQRSSIARLLPLLLLAGVAGCEQQAQQAAPDAAGLAWTPPALADEDWVEPDGREVIQGNIDFMKAQPEVMTEALVSYEAVQESGQTLHFDLLQRLVVQQPDKLHWVTLNDDGSTDSAWFSDGQFTLLRQPANLWGQVRVPPTIPKMVNRLSDEYDVEVPFGDILAADLTELWLGEEVTEVWWVGEAWVEGHWTDHVAVRKPGADLELWVRKGDQPFLAKLAIAFTEEEGQPSYVARFRKWATTLPADMTDFTFTPPPDAERVEVVPVIDE
jgi:hypothetical protein